MKKVISIFILVILFCNTNAQLKLYASIHASTMLMYTPTFGICPSIGISKNKNAFYVTAGYSGRNMLRVYKLNPYTNFTALSYMKFGLGYNRYISISKKSKLNIGAECLINEFDFSKSTYKDTILTYNLNVSGVRSRPLASLHVGYNYFIKKHIAINVTSHVDFKKLSYYRVLPNSSGFEHPLVRHFFIPYVSVGVVFK